MRPPRTRCPSDMNEDRLKMLLTPRSAAVVHRGPDCPDEHLVAGFVDGGLDSATRARIEAHLADCSHCLALVGLLCRGRDTAAVEPVPGVARERAHAPATKLPQRRWRPTPQWAAAAALVLVVPLLLLMGRNLERGSEGQGRPATAVTRTISEDPSGLQLIAPASGSAVDVQRLVFRWTEVRGTPYYDVRIVTDSGDIVVEQRVNGTSWQPSAPLKLQPGAEYFVHVDAYPSGDKAVSSGHVPFRLSD